MPLVVASGLEQATTVKTGPQLGGEVLGTETKTGFRRKTTQQSVHELKKKYKKTLNRKEEN